MGIDAIRSNARREAWKYSDGDSRNFNPFARTVGPYRKPEDEETALRTVRTADDAPSTLQSERWQQNQQHLTSPHRAETDPSPGLQSPAVNHHHLFRHGDQEKQEQVETHPPHLTGISEQPTRSEDDQVSDLKNRNTDISPNSAGAREQKGGIRRRIRQVFHKSNKSEIDGGNVDSKKKKHGKHIPIGTQIRAVLFGSWINLLLICVPVGIALNYAKVDGKIIFVINFIAIIPLAAMLSFATEELAMYVGETLGGLLNASFGNATELIVSIIALIKGEIVIVQTSLIGSMLSNLLLVLGMCFFLGGINRVKQYFNITVAQTASSLLALAIGSLIIPTAFAQFGAQSNSAREKSGEAPISRATSVLLLVVYGSYLLFQLKTHSAMYNEPSQKVEKRVSSKKQKGAAMLGLAQMGAGTAATAGGHVMNQENIVHDSSKKGKKDDDEHGETPTLSVIGALFTLLAATVLIAFCSEFMVDGIAAISESVSQEFIGLILVPIVGNAAEHATAVTVAIKDKMDLAIGVAIGSSMQIALLVTPLMVVLAWCGVGKGKSADGAELTLVFDGFQVVVLFIAILLVNYLIQVCLFPLKSP